MKEAKKIDLNMTGLDELFMTDEQRKEKSLPKIYDIPLSEIDEFPDHPFRVNLDDDMQLLVESIRQRGVLTPVTVRKKDDGRYELISGHRRKKACELAGLDKIRAEVRELSKDEAIRNFMISNVAYCLATFVLGIGDRHNDNIMLKKNGELFHIDFGHFLGHFKYKMGIKRERAPFVFTRQFQNVLGNDNSALFLEFKEKLQKGYLILRKNRDDIVTLLRVLLCTGIPELNEKSLRYLEGTLAMKKEDEEAKNYLEKQLADSLDSVSTKLNFAIHIVANK